MIVQSLRALTRTIACVQKARAEPAWFAGQEAKLRAFVGDLHSKALTLAGLSKAQADALSALALHYGLPTRPMSMLLNKHRLQLLKSPSAAVARPELAAHARLLTDQDVAQLQARDAAAVCELECARPLLSRAFIYKV